MRTTSKSKLSFLFILFLVPLCLVCQTPNKKFYVGLTTGLGVNTTLVNKEMPKSNRQGIVFPIQPSLTYRWNDKWSAELVTGLHIKSYKASINRFFFSDFPQANMHTTESNLTLGLNLHYRQPINTQKSIYLGGTIGMGKFWQTYVGPAGNGSCFRETPILAPTTIPEDCEKSMTANYVFQNSDLMYTLLGLDLEFLTRPEKALDSPILRFSVVSQRGQFGRPLEGNVVFYEGNEVVEEFDFYNTGAFVAFEVGYLLPIGKNTLEN